MMRRTFDIMVALCALTLLAPVMVVLGLAVLASSGSPCLFRQTRVGRHGRDFVMYKFRSMTVNAAAAAGTFEVGNTSRVTGIGRFLRRTKLDELPQLWNVLKGDMSMVGPRPEVRKWVQVYPERWQRVHSVKPGITDPAALVYRDEEQILAAAADPEAAYRDVILPHKLALYEEYARHRSLRGDIGILFRTVRLLTWGRSK